MGSPTQHKISSSLLWSGIEKFSVQGVGFVITLIVSRLITPEDYALIAMLSIFIAVSQVLIDSGVSNSLIQNQQRSDVDYSTVFYINIAIGFCCYLLLFVGAPIIADFYDQSVLIPVTRIYALILVLSSLTLVQKARFFIDFKYKQLSIISIVSLILAGIVAIVMAYKGYGVWALVAYYLLQAFVSSSLIWCISRWYPLWIFSGKSAQRAFSFGSKLLAANLIHTITANIYTLIIGKKYHSAELGYYGRGQSISYIYPSNVSNMFSQAAYPVLCELQNDRTRLKGVFVDYIKTAATLTFPLMTLLAALAEPLVRVLLGDKWLPSVPFVQILAIGYMLDPVMRLNALILSVTGRSKYSLQAEILKKVILILLLLATIPMGLMWLTIGVAVYSILDLLAISFFVKKIIPFNFLDLVKVLLPYVCYSIVTYLAVSMLEDLILAGFLKIAVGILAGLAVYGLLFWAFSRSDFHKIQHIITNLLHKRQ